MEFLTAGIILGLSAGFAPGPLLTLVIAESLQHGIGAGIRVAVAPLITDFPIILLTLVVLSQLSGVDSILGILSLVGSGVLFWMGYESLNPSTTVPVDPGNKPKSLFKGILVNALSPHPYLFWLSVGGSLLNKAMALSNVAVISFIAGFYFFLIGSKVLLAVLVGKSRAFLSGQPYLYIMRFLGLALWVLAAILLSDGLSLLLGP